MRRISVKADKILNARPEDVYATIADYHHGHPQIIPKENFSDLRVEEGGYGAGTIIRFKTKVMGVTQDFYQRVSEPEPGRVLVEQDIEPGQNESSTFTVTPVEQGEKALVEIVVGMDSSGGLKGSIERFVVARAFPSMLRKELDLLEGAAQRRSGSSAIVQ